MNVFRFALTLAVLVVLGGLTPARGADRVLLPGNTPLTQKMVDQYQERWQWYCDVPMSEKQRRTHQRLLIGYWLKKTMSYRQALAAAYSRSYEAYREDLQLEGQEQEWRRAQIRLQWMNVLRKDADASSRYLTALYNAAYKPGGSKNPILVKGNPPLTRVTMDQRIVTVEWLLDAPLTKKQRQKYQRLYIEAWAQADRETRQSRVQSAAGNAALLQQASPYQRHFFRSTNLKRFLTAMAKEDADAVDRWVLAEYRAMSKVGSPRNPLLVPGRPPLTQVLVDRYGDYLEAMLDLSVSGGFSAPQRQTLQRYLVKDWKKMDARTREKMLADLKRWADATGKGAAEANKLVPALRPKLLVQLRTAGNERSQWLLEIANQERKKADLLSDAERRRHGAAMKLIDNLRPFGHWGYNARTGRYEWMPCR